VYNWSVAVQPDGRELARYAKLQLFTLGGEADNYQPGDSLVLFHWHDFPVAMFVCYDLRFPEIVRPAIRRGAALLTVIANWPEARDAHWQALLRARAIENQCYVVGVNRAGSDPRFGYLGHSMILAPSGETLAAAGESPECIAADVDFRWLEEYRRKLPFLADMRHDVQPPPIG
jgi:predicted amidohydrolase